AALTSFTRGLSRELGPQGITVNLVQPGSVDTDANPADGPAADFQRSLTSLGRFAKPSEIANAVVFLSSPAASRLGAKSASGDQHDTAEDLVVLGIPMGGPCLGERKPSVDWHGETAFRNVGEHHVD
ncbi:hypothetical protein KXV54_009387, partial [Aspergillus fumigatus]